jgi:hypothetical protein
MKNRISMSFTPDVVQRIGVSISALEVDLSALIALSQDERRDMF